MYKELKRDIEMKQYGDEGDLKMTEAKSVENNKVMGSLEGGGVWICIEANLVLVFILQSYN